MRGTQIFLQVGDACFATIIVTYNIKVIVQNRHNIDLRNKQFKGSKQILLLNSVKNELISDLKLNALISSLPRAVFQYSVSTPPS